MKMANPEEDFRVEGCTMKIEKINRVGLSMMEYVGRILFRLVFFTYLLHSKFFDDFLSVKDDEDIYVSTKKYEFAALVFKLMSSTTICALTCHYFFPQVFIAKPPTQILVRKGLTLNCNILGVTYVLGDIIYYAYFFVQPLFDVFEPDSSRNNLYLALCLTLWVFMLYFVASLQNFIGLSETQDINDEPDQTDDDIAFQCSMFFPYFMFNGRRIVLYYRWRNNKTDAAQNDAALEEEDDNQYINEYDDDDDDGVYGDEDHIDDILSDEDENDNKWTIDVPNPSFGTKIIPEMANLEEEFKIEGFPLKIKKINRVGLLMKYMGRLLLRLVVYMYILHSKFNNFLSAKDDEDIYVSTKKYEFATLVFKLMASTTICALTCHYFFPQVFIAKPPTQILVRKGLALNCNILGVTYVLGDVIAYAYFFVRPLFLLFEPDSSRNNLHLALCLTLWVLMLYFLVSLQNLVRLSETQNINDEPDGTKHDYGFEAAMIIPYFASIGRRIVLYYLWRNNKTVVTQNDAASEEDATSEEDYDNQYINEYDDDDYDDDDGGVYGDEDHIDDISDEDENDNKWTIDVRNPSFGNDSIVGTTIVHVNATLHASECIKVTVQEANTFHN